MNDKKGLVMVALKAACKERFKSDFVTGLSVEIDSDYDCLQWAGAHTKDVFDMCGGFVSRSYVLKALNDLELDGDIAADRSASPGGCICWWPNEFYGELKRCL